jgi:thiol-disulfide isomerase/thioredoxin
MKKAALFIFISVLLATGCNLVSSKQSNTNDGKTASTETKNVIDYPNMPASLKQSEIQLIDAKTLKLEQYDGKVIIVNIWGTWCGPCRDEIPELMKLQEEFGSKGLQVVGLSLGRDEISEPEFKVKSFAKGTKINYDIGFLNERTRKGLNDLTPIGAVPMSYVFSKDGKIRAIFQGGGPRTVEKLRTVVEKAIDE